MKNKTIPSRLTKHKLENFLSLTTFDFLLSFVRCCGAKWKRMTLHERQPYMEESERLKQLHAQQYPTYKVIIDNF